MRSDALRATAATSGFYLRLTQALVLWWGRMERDPTDAQSPKRSWASNPSGPASIVPARGRLRRRHGDEHSAKPVPVNLQVPVTPELALMMQPCWPTTGSVHE